MSNKVYESLPCQLTESEMTQKRDEIAQSVQAYREVETQKREACKTWGDEMKGHRARTEKLSEEITSRTEHRTVECYWKKNRKAGRMELIRTDSREVVETRPMSVDEAQDKLPGHDEDEAATA